MVVTIDPSAGFCFGVVRAVKTAENEILQGRQLSSLGDLVHNEQEIKRLNKIGLRSVTPDMFENIHNQAILIRAHGEPPETFKTAKKNNVTLIDATCPIVTRLQQRIAVSHVEMKERGGQVLIYGKQGHPEVTGLLGYTDGEAVVVKEEKDMENIDFSRPLRLYSQTTMSREGFEKIREKISALLDGHSDFKAYNTVCGQISGRVPLLIDFAGQHDVIIFVSGKKSSNGNYLYGICKEVNPASYFISAKKDIDEVWFENVKTVGVSGATSTPVWMLEEVAEAITNK